MIALNVFTQEMLQPAEQANDDFLNALLVGSDSVSASPLWSPSPSDSGISEDPASDQMDSPRRPESPPGDSQFFGARPLTKAALEANVSTDLSKSQISKSETFTLGHITNWVVINNICHHYWFNYRWLSLFNQTVEIRSQEISSNAIFLLLIALIRSYLLYYTRE